MGDRSRRRIWAHRAREPLARHRRLLLAAALAGLCVGAAIPLLRPPEAVATTSLILNHAVGDDAAEAMATDVSLARSRELAVRVVHRLHLRETPDELLTHYSARARTDRILQLSARARTGAEAELLVRTIGQAFLIFRVEQNSGRLASLRRLLVDARSEATGLHRTAVPTLTAGGSDEDATKERIYAADERVRQVKDQIAKEEKDYAPVAHSLFLDPPTVRTPSRLAQAGVDGAKGLAAGLGVTAVLLVLSGLLAYRPRREQEIVDALGMPVGAAGLPAETAPEADAAPWAGPYAAADSIFEADAYAGDEADAYAHVAAGSEAEPYAPAEARAETDTHAEAGTSTDTDTDTATEVDVDVDVATEADTAAEADGATGAVDLPAEDTAEAASAGAEPDDGRHGTRELDAAVDLFLRQLAMDRARRPALLVVAVECVPAAAAAVAALARRCADGGDRVLLADLSRNGVLARRFGALGPGTTPVLGDGAGTAEITVDRTDAAAPRGRLHHGAADDDDDLMVAWALSDVVVTLAELPASGPVGHLHTWADRAVTVVSTERSSVAKLRSVGELVRAAGLSLESVVVLDAAQRAVASDLSADVASPASDLAAHSAEHSR